MGKSGERRESVIKKRRETTDRCGKKVEGTESIYIFLNAEGNQMCLRKKRRERNMCEKKGETTERVGKKR